MSNPSLNKTTFADLLELQLPGLPSSRDKLFTSEEDWWNNACLDSGSNGWILYAAGYKDAADILVAQVEERSAGQDTLVYPILFLYRQYLELEIKDTLRAARQLQDISSDPPVHHRIADLWTELHKHLLEISPGDSVKELQAIGRLIREFAEADPLSFAFRYPVDKRGNPSLPSMTQINLRNVREVMAKIDVTLSGAGSLVYEHLQFKLDQEREFRDACY